MSNPTLIGDITLTRRLREHAVWQRQDYGWAWVDMLLLANNRDGAKHLNGEFVDVKRGQLLWSLRGLEREWHKSGEWLNAFLKFCKDQSMIQVDANRRRTIITILNYEAYNPTVTGSETVTDTGTVTGSETVTLTEQKVEERNRREKGEAEPQQKQGFAECPDEAEVLTFGRTYPGDLSRDIPPTMPDRWCRDWFRYKVGSGNWSKKWREKMAADFRDDWTSGHPKARAGLEKKNGGRSPAQARFELSRELEEVQTRLDALHEVGAQPSARDKAREKELKKLIRELPE